VSTITLNGSNVSEWRDKSGLGSPAAAQSTGANQPAYNSTGVNAKASIDFDASESLVFGSSTASFNYLHNATGGTVFCVWKADALADPNAIRYLLTNSNNSSANTGISVFFDDRSSVSRNNVLSASVFRGASGQTTSGIATSNNFVPAADDFNVLSISFDNGNATAANRLFAFSNGVSSGISNTSSNAAASANASTNMIIGNFGGGGSLGSIAELMFYQGILSSSQRQSVERYLGKKYGIGVA
jgi:hypothetical protein